MSNRVTLKDVAARAGVSQTTISLFLNGNTGVCSEETAERIRTALTELNYTRSRQGSVAAATLPTAATAGTVTAAPPVVAYGAGAGVAGPTVRRRTRTLGMALPNAGDLLDPNGTAPSRVTDQVWHGASQVAEWEEFCLLSYPARLRETTDTETFLDGSISGLILNAGYADPRPAQLAAAGLPVVVLHRFLAVPDTCGSVCAYESDTVELAMNHLWELGHRRIAHYAGPVEVPGTAAESAPLSAPQIRHTPSDIAIRRLERYEIWMRQNGAYDPRLTYAAETDWQGEHAAEALATWWALPEGERPTAVFCANDTLAVRLREAAEKMGLSVPGDLSLVGVGDSNRAAESGLTSVVIPGEQIGREAVRLLLRMIDGAASNPSERRRAIPVTQIAVRESTAPPATAAGHSDL